MSWSFSSTFPSEAPWGERTMKASSNEGATNRATKKRECSAGFPDSAALCALFSTRQQ
jgi:hypothetical protein